MIRRKICMVGDFAVGKTSLVARFVHRTFSARYMTTVGVKVDTCAIALETGEDLTLVVWDLAGDSSFSGMAKTHLRGSSGYLLVADGTRAATLDVAEQLDLQARTILGELPRVLLLNKYDLTPQWQIPKTRVQALRAHGMRVHLTSALTGKGVARAFHDLAILVAP